MATLPNACAFTVSNTPGNSSGFVVAAVLSGPYRIPRAAEDGAGAFVFVREGDTWEICASVYDHATTTWSRGALSDSSGASVARQNFSGACIVHVVGFVAEGVAGLRGLALRRDASGIAQAVQVDGADWDSVLPVPRAGAVPNYRIGAKYATMDSTVYGCVLFDGSDSRPNKLGVNAAPVDGGFAADTNYVAGTANVAAVLSGYDNVVNGLACGVASQHSIIDSGSDHSWILGGSRNQIRGTPTTLTQHANIFGGTSNKIDAGCSYSLIIGGDKNTLDTGGTVDTRGFRSIIVGGTENTSGARNSLILGGSGVSVTGKYSVAVNASLTDVQASYAHAQGAGITIQAMASYAYASGDTIDVSGTRSWNFGDNIVNAYSHGWAFGSRLVVPHEAARVHSARQRGNVAGRNQGIQYHCSNESTNVATVRLSLYGSSAYPVLPLSAVVHGEAYVTGIDLATGNTSCYKIQFAVRRSSADVMSILAQTTTTIVNGAGVVTAPTINTTTGGIYRVQVVGVSDLTMAWDAEVIGQQVVFS